MLRTMHIAVLALSALCLLSFKGYTYPQYTPPAPPPVPVETGQLLSELFMAMEQPGRQASVTYQVPRLKITVVRNVRVTACSPFDPQDIEYYRKYGYEGSDYGVAALYRQFPKGTLIRVPGYRSGNWHVVDSAGGSVIRRSASVGRRHIDVKFKTYYSAIRWGSKTIDVEVIYPADQVGAVLPKVYR